MTSNKSLRQRQMQRQRLNGAQLLRRKPPSTTIPLRDAQEMLALSAALSTADPGSAYEVLAVKCERMSEQDTHAAAQRLLQRHQALRLQFVPADHVQAEIPTEEFEIRYEELGSWDAVRDPHQRSPEYRRDTNALTIRLPRRPRATGSVRRNHSSSLYR